MPRLVAEAQGRLETMPGIRHARLEFVCCEQGKTILYVGIQEKGFMSLQFLPAPRGAVRLPAEIVEAGDAFDEAFETAVMKGDASEEHSQGHALNHNPAARAVEQRYVALAASNLASLREVLRNSADAGQRALAAQVIGYAPDKRVVTADLEYAMLDSDPNVRNNAMRALWVIAEYARTDPRLKIEIDPQPFVQLLSSLIWTDRNKSSVALMALTEGRDPALLADLRVHAQASLAEMARWKTGHANAACVILGRIAGLPEEQIADALDHGQKERLISAAQDASSGK